MKIVNVMQIMQNLKEQGIDAIENGVVREVLRYDEYPSEYAIMYKDGNTSQGFGGCNLKYRTLLWRKKFLEAVIGKSMFKIKNLSVLSPEIYDIKNFEKQIVGIPLNLLMEYDIIKGIINLSNAKRLEDAFIPSTCEELWKSNDVVEVKNAFEQAKIDISNTEAKIVSLKSELEEKQNLLKNCSDLDQRDKICKDISFIQYEIKSELRDIETAKTKLSNYEDFKNHYGSELEVVGSQKQPGDEE